MFTTWTRAVDKPPEIDQIITVSNDNWNYVYNDVMFMLVDVNGSIEGHFILKEQSNTGGIAAYYQTGGKYLGFRCFPTHWKPQNKPKVKPQLFNDKPDDVWDMPKKTVNKHPHFAPPTNTDNFIQKKTKKKLDDNGHRPNSKRVAIYERDKYTCQNEFCGSKENLTLDHIKPSSRGGSNDMSNLQTLCSSCNGRKSDQYPYVFTY